MPTIYKSLVLIFVGYSQYICHSRFWGCWGQRTSEVEFWNNVVCRRFGKYSLFETKKPCSKLYSLNFGAFTVESERIFNYWLVGWSCVISRKTSPAAALLIPDTGFTTLPVTRDSNHICSKEIASSLWLWSCKFAERENKSVCEWLVRKSRKWSIGG